MTAPYVRCPRATGVTAYRMDRDASGATRAMVLRGIEVRPLPELGGRFDGVPFDYGVTGEGSANLARSIVSFHIGVLDPDPALYTAFQFAFLVSTKRDEPLQLDAETVDRWFAERAARDREGASS